MSSTKRPRINSIALYGSSRYLLGYPGAFLPTYIPREPENREPNPQISLVTSPLSLPLNRSSLHLLPLGMLAEALISTADC
jgi:hypothetical protein